MDDLGAQFLGLPAQKILLGAALGLVAVVLTNALSPAPKEEVKKVVSKKDNKSRSTGGGEGKKSSTKKKSTSKKSQPKTTPVAPAPVVEPAKSDTNGSSAEPASKSSKKKKKRKKNKNTNKDQEQQESSTTNQPEPELVNDAVEDDADSDDDEDDQAARLLGLEVKKSSAAFATSSTGKSKKKKKKKKALEDKGGDDDMQVVSTKGKGKGGKKEASGSSVDPTITLSIGPDAAIIIGPGGSIIQNIEKMSDAKLDILKNTPGPGQNTVRITATSEQSIAQAMELVQSIIDVEEKKNANKKSVTLTPADIKGSDGVKAIIGRGGQTIKDIESRCPGVKIDANVEGGTVVVSGPKEQVEAAVTLCKNAVFGEAQSAMDLKTRSAVNIVFGKDFGTIRELQKSTGAKLDIEKGTNLITFSGKAEQVAAAKEAVTALLSQCAGVTMEIKAADIGAVYGKAGSNIRKIQEHTGAFVEIKQNPGAPSATCKIMGESASVEQARKSIQRVIDGEIELKPGEILKTLVLGSATPAVIGRAGSKVKELERVHCVQINVNGDTGLCRIVGKEKAVKAALEAIQTIVQPILSAEAAKAEANVVAEAGDSAWQATAIAADEDGW